MAILQYNNNLLLSDNELQLFDGVNPSGSTTINDTSKHNVSRYATAIVPTQSDLSPSNIRENTTILGVTGTLHEGIEPTGTKEITDLSQQNVREYQYAQIVDANLIADNIRNNTQILGITGTYDNLNPQLQTKTIAPDPTWTSAQIITQDSGYDGLAQLNISAIPYTETLNAAGGYTVQIF